MADMIGKTYSYSVLATKTVGDGYWMYIRVVSEWNNLGVILDKNEPDYYVCSRLEAIRINREFGVEYI